MGSRYNQMQAVLCLVVVIAMGCMQIRSVSAADPDPLVDNPLNLTSFTLRDIFHNGDVSSVLEVSVLLWTLITFLAPRTYNISMHTDL